MVEPVYHKYARYRTRLEERENEVQLFLDRHERARYPGSEREEAEERQRNPVSINREVLQPVSDLWRTVFDHVGECSHEQ